MSSNRYNLPIYDLSMNYDFNFGGFILNLPTLFNKIEIQRMIKQSLANQHSLTKFDWDSDKCCYIVEYRTRPAEYDQDLDEDLVAIRRNIVNKTVALALEKFPHNNEQSGEFSLEMPSLTPQWCEFKLKLVWDDSYNKTRVIISLLNGDHVSYGMIVNIIYNYLKKKNEDMQYLLMSVIEGYGVEPNYDVLKNCDDYLRDYLTRDFI